MIFMPNSATVTIQADFTEPDGKIKPVNGVGQPPFPVYAPDFSYFSYLKEANIPFSRLHDTGGAYGSGRYVDVPNIFRRFDADPSDPDSYDFTFTDLLISALIEYGVEPFFRLGVTIENAAAVKAYRIDPPADFLQWAKICEGIIRHYTQGWANGFEYNIRYWEIWNEPDLSRYGSETVNQCWSGSPEQYYEFYTVASSYLKSRFPNIKIGGYASAGFREGETHRTDFFTGFLDYIRSHGAPLDFFSWHSYRDTERTLAWADYVRTTLDKSGYKSAETTCNEWNCEPFLAGTARHAALTAERLAAFQDSPVDSAMFYDARIGGESIYAGLFQAINCAPLPAYYVFKAFGELYRLGTRATVKGDLPKGLAVIAAGDGKRGGIMITNTAEQSVPLKLEIKGQKAVSCRLIDAGHLFLPFKFPDRAGQDKVWFIETVKE